jgi:hypothetical protein
MAMGMTPYKNHNSGVTAYALGKDSIRIRFKEGSVYLYTNKVTGSEHVRQMKKLAKEGRGLSTFISTVVKNKYAEKIT